MKFRKILPPALTVAVPALMVLLSEVLGQREIIFPEIAAIAAGMLLAPRRAWVTNRLRVLILISVSAALGLGISVYAPLPLWGKMTLAFVLAQAILVFSGTGFAPMISAAVLPVLLGTESPVYLVAAITLTGLILLVSLLLERMGLRQAESFQPLPAPDGAVLRRTALKCVLGTACIVLALGLRFRFAVAPPMLVAFTEFMNPENKAKQQPLQAIGLVFACALAGALCRLLFTERLGLPLWTSTAAACGVAVLLMLRTQMFLPPAAALTVLAMLIGADVLPLYPVQILVGITVLMGLAKLTEAIAAHRTHAIPHT